MEEIWIDAFGFENKYSVSNLGKVKSKPRIKIRKNGRRLTVKGKLLSFQINKDGYYMVELHEEDGTNSPKLVHKLIWESFNGKIPITNPQVEVCHNDGNNKNNSLDNLYLDTHKNNCNHPLTRKRQSERMKGNTISKGLVCKNRIPIVRLNLDYTLVKEYPCITDVICDGFSIGNVSACCQNKYGVRKNVSKNYIFMTKDNYERMQDLNLVLN